MWQLAAVVFCVVPLLLELAVLCSLGVRSALVPQRPGRPTLWLAFAPAPGSK